MKNRPDGCFRSQAEQAGEAFVGSRIVGYKVSQYPGDQIMHTPERLDTAYDIIGLLQLILISVILFSR